MVPGDFKKKDSKFVSPPGHGRWIRCVSSEDRDVPKSSDEKLSMSFRFFFQPVTFFHDKSVEGPHIFVIRFFNCWGGQIYTHHRVLNHSY